MVECQWQQQQSSKERAKHHWMPPRLLDFGLGVFDVFSGDRVVFLLFHLVGLGARILPRHIVVTGAGGGDQLDLETDGFGHGLFP